MRAAHRAAAPPSLWQAGSSWLTLMRPLSSQPASRVSSSEPDRRGYPVRTRYPTLRCLSLPVPLTRGADWCRYVQGEIDVFMMEQRATKLKEAINNVLPDRFAALREHIDIPHVQLLHGSEEEASAAPPAPDAAPEAGSGAAPGGKTGEADVSDVKVEVGDSGGASGAQMSVRGRMAPAHSRMARASQRRRPCPPRQCRSRTCWRCGGQ